MSDEKLRHAADPAARLAHFSLKARQVVEGVLSGIHKSPHVGSSIEFLEHKQYTPGDEIRQIDWKLLARTDRHYIKQFENETNVRAYLVLDSSASMEYASPGRESKFDYACGLAASLAWLMLRQSDAVALMTLSNSGPAYIPPRSRPGHLQALLSALSAQSPGRGRSLARLMEEAAGRVRRRSIVIVITDALEPLETVISGLKLLRYRRNEVILFQTLDPWELEFPFSRLTLFESLEDDRRLMADAAAARRAYLEALGDFMESLRRECEAHGMDYRVMNTGVPLQSALSEFLAARAAAGRAGSTARRPG
ncbi:MAG TPA: DUF58 domain-containing protein [Candidatus Brocadiia bacterium]|nr:DUF58 domain-containing protein [Candidatus Brocadiia bacterium]